jgi:DnaK suppressor protein
MSIKLKKESAEDIVSSGLIDSGALPVGYKPSANEEYMNDSQLAYFRIKLINWKNELLEEGKGTLEYLKTESFNEPDLYDRASKETDALVDFRKKERYKKLISKIDAAIRRIDSKDYGYCEVSGKPIGLKRLEARPIATMTIEAQEDHERKEED